MDSVCLKGVGSPIEVKTIEKQSSGLWLMAAKQGWPFERGSTVLQMQTEQLKIPTDKRLTSWLFTQGSQGVEIGTTENKST